MAEDPTSPFGAAQPPVADGSGQGASIPAPTAIPASGSPYSPTAPQPVVPASPWQPSTAASYAPTSSGQQASFPPASSGQQASFPSASSSQQPSFPPASSTQQPSFPPASSGQQASVPSASFPPTSFPPVAAIPPAGPTPPVGNWPAPSGAPVGQSYATAVTSTPVAASSGKTPVRNNLALQIVAVIMAFLLGAGTLAIVERLVQAANPAPTYPTGQNRTGRGTNPNYPGYPGGGPGGVAPTTQPTSQPTAPSTTNPTGAPRSRTSTTVTPEQSVGIVYVNTTLSGGVAAGTGMVLDANGAVLTNYHVVAGSETVSVTVADSGDTYKASVVGFDQSKDVALLQLSNASGLATITIDNDPLAVGDTVSTVGNAGGHSRLVRADGKVRALDQALTVSSDSPWGAEENLSGLIQTNANAVPGDSGGPMFDSQNEVTGMTTAGSTDQSTSFAVPIADAMQVIRTIQAGHDSGTTRVGPAGYLGVNVATDNTGVQGQLILGVIKGGPADKIGIIKGSTLTSVNGKQVRASTNLASLIRVLEPGDKVKVTWIAPDGQHRSATATVGASPIN